MLSSLTNPVWVELFSYVNAFFCSNKVAYMDAGYVSVNTIPVADYTRETKAIEIRIGWNRVLSVCAFSIKSLVFQPNGRISRMFSVVTLQASSIKHDNEEESEKIKYATGLRSKKKTSESAAHFLAFSFATIARLT